jgi:hypothetical protein
LLPELLRDRLTLLSYRIEYLISVN